MGRANSGNVSSCGHSLVVTAGFRGCSRDKPSDEGANRLLVGEPFTNTETYWASQIIQRRVQSRFSTWVWQTATSSERKCCGSISFHHEIPPASDIAMLLTHPCTQNQMGIWRISTWTIHRVNPPINPGLSFSACANSAFEYVKCLLQPFSSLENMFRAFARQKERSATLIMKSSFPAEDHCMHVDLHLSECFRGHAQDRAACRDRLCCDCVVACQVWNMPLLDICHILAL